MSFTCVSFFSVPLNLSSFLAVSSHWSCWKILILEAAVLCSAWCNGMFVFLHLLNTFSLFFCPGIWLTLSCPFLILSFSYSLSLCSGIWWILSCCILLSNFKFSRSFFFQCLYFLLFVCLLTTGLVLVLSFNFAFSFALGVWLFLVLEFLAFFFSFASTFFSKSLALCFQHFLCLNLL